MQKRVGKPSLVPEIRSLAQQIFQRMPVWQRLKRSDEIANLSVRSMNTYASTELLQHVDAGPSVRRIYHEMHRAVRFEHTAESSEPRIRVGKMMENSRADNLIEGLFQLAHPIDGKLVDLEIIQVVFLLEFLSTAYARCAEIDAGNFSGRAT